ncbi:tetratricopeptide repeat protein [Streptomyces sp. 71268]|uniref:tetratricopeptide repeat protein n=1 Tax=Streptomyces sp. 71268 TaxID=3002640 RepID=UPI0023F6E6EC|nr:tetratricopeptide repeat protein [Streptomyces sp. 71268]WEV25331.1 tetratricopeptide repeat protein [Streptomyces sp. 71268]
MTTEHPLTAQAGALIELERYDDAKALLARRLAEDPTDVRAWTRLGRCHQGTKDHAEALRATDEALAIAPEDYNAMLLRAYVLRSLHRWEEAQQAARAAIGLNSEYFAAYSLLAELLFLPPRQETWQEAVELAREAVRLGPEEVSAYMTLWKVAAVAHDTEWMDQIERRILQLDPTHSLALEKQTAKAANAPGVRAADAAEMYAGALATAPTSSSLSYGLDRATYRLLRGTRWLALICLVCAGAMVNLFPEEGEAPELPVPIGTRLWVLVVMAAIWAFGAFRRYRRLRAGVQLNVRSVLRRGTWSRIVLAQAALALLCGLLIAEVPWTERTVPQMLFWVGLAPTAATIWFDRKKAK